MMNEEAPEFIRGRTSHGVFIGYTTILVIYIIYYESFYIYELK
jgi:hypothetical protein